MEDVTAYLNFIKEIEGLKDVLRSGWTAQKRQESTAEHSWRLAVLAGLALQQYPHLDSHKVMMMALLHDIGELYDGDIPAVLRPDEQEKLQSEERAARKVFGLLPEPGQTQLYRIWAEYTEALTPEARLVKALDKAETIIQHNQGDNPPDFDYGFNLEYGQEYFTGDEWLTELRRRLDQDTKDHIPEK